MPQDLNEITLRSEEVHEALSRPPSWLVCWGITMIFIIILLLLFISWWVKYPDFINSKILVTTQVPAEKIEAKTSGRIARLFVKDHQLVKKGQVLALLANPADYQDVLTLKELLNNTVADSRGIFFPIERTTFLSLGEIEADYVAFEKNYTEYRTYHRLDPHTPEMISAKELLAELGRRMQEARAQLSIQTKTFEYIKKDKRRTQRLFDEGVISAQELEKKNMEYLSAQNRHKGLLIEISRINEGMNNARKSIKKTEVSQKQQDTEHFNAVIRAYNQLKNTIRDWEMKYLLTASIDGWVSFQKYWGENQFVKQAEVVPIILPKSDKGLLGKIILPARNTGKIKTGQKVLIKLDNYPYQEFGIVLGKVKRISLSTDEQGNYYVEVSLPRALKTTHHKRIPFKREMQGAAEIVTEDIRLIERVFYSFKKLFQYNDKDLEET